MIERAQSSSPAQRGNLPLRRSIVLVGLMGAGKTSVGKRVAAQLGVGFADSDVEIAEAAGMSIPEIFAEFGEPAFRDGERRVIARLLAGPPGVIATGGGAFVETRTRAEIAACATSVWIRAELALLWERVRGRPGRPLLATADPLAVLAELDAKRAPLYRLADVVVDSRRGASHDAMAVAIIEAVRARDLAEPDGAGTFGPAATRDTG
jgi:shikimate kinase